MAKTSLTLFSLVHVRPCVFAGCLRADWSISLDLTYVPIIRRDLTPDSLQ